MTATHRPAILGDRLDVARELLLSLCCGGDVRTHHRLAPDAVLDLDASATGACGSHWRFPDVTERQVRYRSWDGESTVEVSFDERGQVVCVVLS